MSQASATATMSAELRISDALIALDRALLIYSACVGVPVPGEQVVDAFWTFAPHSVSREFVSLEN